MSLLISIQTLFTADLCTFITLFGTYRCKFTNYIRNMQVKKRKKIKRNKMEQSRFAALCYFCAYNKKLLEMLNFK